MQNQSTLLQLVEQIVEALEDCHLDAELIHNHNDLLSDLAARLGITPTQALFMAVFINMADDHNITARDLGRFFDCRPVKILSQWENIEALAQQHYIRLRDNNSDSPSIMVPSDVLLAFRKNEVYHTPTYEHLTIDAWMDQLCDLMNERDVDHISYDDLKQQISTLKANNTHLSIVQKLQKLHLATEDEIVLLRTIGNLVENNDEQIGYSDIKDILHAPSGARVVAREITRGQHVLIKNGLIEYVNDDGRANTSAWHLSDKTKNSLLDEVALQTNTDPKNGLILAESLTKKQLFFNEETTKAVNRLRVLLGKERFSQVQQQLEAKGMRRGFACIFYGSPGTGKTESVYQLARETGRHIMLVDVPNLRSKWVGDTEKNVKAVFDRYRSLVQQSSLAPILLFNEADAVLCRRNEGATGSVDKMENAMQNIILQEMENLDGIMIATTNLTDNLDKAFERRFLYKIQFPKPTAKERKPIWQTMLPDLSEENVTELATRFDFSGGQIENIARKQVVDSILNGETGVNMATILEACTTETLHGRRSTTIGFA